jgi:hypothetical protein
VTERDDRLWQSGYVVLPGDLGFSLPEGHAYRRCPVCGGYFRMDDFVMKIDHHGCQPEKAPGKPTTGDRRR